MQGGGGRELAVPAVLLLLVPAAAGDDARRAMDATTGEDNSVAPAADPPEQLLSLLLQSLSAALCDRMPAVGAPNAARTASVSCGLLSLACCRAAAALRSARVWLSCCSSATSAGTAGSSIRSKRRSRRLRWVLTVLASRLLSFFREQVAVTAQLRGTPGLAPTALEQRDRPHETLLQGPRLHNARCMLACWELTPGLGVKIAPRPCVTNTESIHGHVNRPSRHGYMGQRQS